jgi:putative oxidoreductase
MACSDTPKNELVQLVCSELEPVHFFPVTPGALLSFKKNYMKQLSYLFNTQAHTHGLVTRIALAIVLWPHGAQLLLGTFGGLGFENSMNYFTQVEGLPWIVGVSVIFIQFFGPLLLLIGAFGRLIGSVMIGLFLGMVITTHWKFGFFMNWFGTKTGEGFEFHILAIGLASALVLSGSGSYSVDALLTKRINMRRLEFAKVASK